VISPTQNPVPDKTALKTSMPPVGLEPAAIPASEQMQTHASHYMAMDWQGYLFSLY
jgi:hypothetical protein